MIKYKDKFNKSYELYKKLGTEAEFILPEVLVKMSLLKDDFDKETGVDAKEFFFKRDSGIVCNEGCKEFDLYISIENGKAMLNFFIDQWVEGYKDGVSPPYEIIEHCNDNNYPEWVVNNYLARIGKGPHTNMANTFKYLGV